MKFLLAVPAFALLVAISVAQPVPAPTAAVTAAPQPPQQDSSTSPQPQQPSQTPQRQPPQPQPPQPPQPPAQQQPPQPQPQPQPQRPQPPPQQQSPGPQRPPPRPQPQPRPQQNAFAWLSRSSVHTVFVGLIRSGKLPKLFSDTRDITVFAPTNAGFLTTLRDFRYRNAGDGASVLKIWTQLLEAKADQLNLTRILRYHVGLGRLSRQQVSGKTARFADSFIPTKSGDTIAVKISTTSRAGFQLQDNAKAIPNANITTPLDVALSNGVVHAIDRVLLPTNLNRPDITAEVERLQKGASSSGTICFPMSATVRSADGQTFALKDLRGGHRVHVSEGGDTSAVFLFSHRVLGGTHDFVRLTTRSGHALSLSAGHYVYANGRLTAARAVRVGDVLRTVRGPSRVASVREVRDRGLVAPHTLHGDIVVDGIVASTYTTTVHPRVAQIMLAPLRAVVRLGIATEPIGAALYNGADRIARILPSGPERY